MNYWILNHAYWANISASTHCSLQVHLSGPHSHPLSHISTTMEYTCCSDDKKTEGGDRGFHLEPAVMYQTSGIINKGIQSSRSEAELVNHLAGSAVGQALLVVSWPIGVCATGTPVSSSRWEQTQLTAASIVGLTWMSRHCRVEKTWIWEHYDTTVHFKPFVKIIMKHTWIH